MQRHLTDNKVLDPIELAARSEVLCWSSQYSSPHSILSTSVVWGKCHFVVVSFPLLHGSAWKSCEMY